MHHCLIHWRRVCTLSELQAAAQPDKQRSGRQMKLDYKGQGHKANGHRSKTRRQSELSLRAAANYHASPAPLSRSFRCYLLNLSRGSQELDLFFFLTFSFYVLFLSLFFPFLFLSNVTHDLRKISLMMHQHVLNICSHFPTKKVF